MKTLAVVFFALSLPAWAGSSLVLSNQTVTRTNVSARPANGACRMEAMLHGVDASPSNLFQSMQGSACGINWQWLNAGPTDIRLQLYSERVTGGSVCQILGVQNHLSTGFYIRFQIVPSGAGGEQRCQAWDINGNRFFSATQPYTGTTGSNSNGMTISGAGTGKNLPWGFLKLYTTNVGMQARMPVHGENGDLLSWRFDGSLNDTSGHGYNGNLSGGSASYVSTPGQGLIQAVVKTSPSPKWGDRRTLRVGAPNAMDATSSFSQNDTSPLVTCDWSVTTTAPSGIALNFNDATENCSPTVTPSGFGDYSVTVTLTDAAMSTAAVSLHLGAVEMDEHGVVQTTPQIRQIFGPMIALGWNPWGLADERELYAHNARRAVYQAPRPTAPSFTMAHPEWDNPQPGTVSYVWNGRGVLGAAGTTLTSAISSTATAIPVADAGVLELSEFPTKIQLHSGNFQLEEVDICGASATTGPATLTVCYDGRGKDDASNMSSVVGATNWASGALVGQSLIKGTGTDFTGGAEKLCEAGAGPMGPITYQSGTVSVTPGSANITGSGTNWGTGQGVLNGYAIRIEGTHGGGTPFVFVAFISAVNSTTSITANRAFPADADAASGLTYQIVRSWYRLPVVSFSRVTYGGTGLIVWGGTSCSSDTQAFFNTGFIGHDVGGYNGSSFSGQTQAFLELDSSVLNQSATGGNNFYGEDLAWFSLHLRSGLAEPKETAEMLSNRWIRYPSLRGGISGPVTSPLFLGGGVIGGMTCVVLNPDCELNWGDVRGFVQQGKRFVETATCISADSRDGGYLGAWLAMGALYDPDTAPGGFRQQWRDALDNWEALEKSCKGPDNSWATGFYTNFNGSPGVTFTNGSTAGTGSSLPEDFCLGVAQGTFSISGSTITALSGTFSSVSSHVNIVLNDGTKRLFTRIQFVDSTHATLHAQWTGASTGTWMQLNGLGGEAVGMTVWGQNASSASLVRNYECIRNNPTTITLERPWEDLSATYFRYTANLAGKGQQPYMLAIKQFGFNLAANLDSEMGTDFAALRNAAAAFVANVGYDPQIKGMRYGTNFQSCEPASTGNTGSVWKQPGCSYGTDAASQVGARMLNGESARGFVNNPVNNQERGDEAYAALWCSTQYNDASLYAGIPACDAAAPGDNMGLSNLGDGSFSGGKWSGFFFGMGMAHQWPAARLLGLETGSQRLNGSTQVNGEVH